VAVHFADHSDGFGGECLLDDLGGAVGTFAQAITDKRRVGHFDQNVVHAVDVHVLDAALVHVVQDAPVAQGTVKPTVAICSTTNEGSSHQTG
jgi:hypothetical protein